MKYPQSETNRFGWRPDARDRALIRATQDGLPLVPEPYAHLAATLEMTVEEVMARLRELLDRGAIRRIGIIPNHYALGYRFNGMSVWDVPDSEVDRLGAAVGALPFVSHCYRRPRHPPVWPYNLFAMVHGRRAEDVEAQVAQIRELLGDPVRQHRVLFSTRLLKKTGLKLATPPDSLRAGPGASATT